MGFLYVNLDNFSLLIANLSSFVFCIFMVVFMRSVLETQNNSNARFIFKRLIVVVVACLTADMMTYIFDTRVFFGATFFNHVSMFFSVLLTVYVGSVWHLFFDATFHVDAASKTRKWIYMIPVFTAFICLFVNLFTGWLFYFDSNNVYFRGPFVFVSFFLQYFLLGALIIRAVFFRFNVKTIRYAKLRISFILVGSISLVFGLFQILALGKIALHCFGVTASIFIMFLRFQDDQITNDLLTGLNNRYALDAYIEDKIKIYHDGMHGRNQLYLVMMDVNYFKRINDIYGHLEGDRALKSVALTLKKIGSTYKNNLFIARFGGDEFSAVFESNSEHRVIELCNDIKNTLKRETESEKYHLTIGTGYALYTGKNMSISALYKMADKALYEDKDRMKNLITDEL